MTSFARKNTLSTKEKEELLALIEQMPEESEEMKKGIKAGVRKKSK